jgi:hypothetical protein
MLRRRTEGIVTVWITPFGAHPVVRGRSCLTPNLPFCPGIWDLISLIDGCAPDHAAACARPAGPLLSAGGGADAGSPGNGQELIPRRAGHSVLSGGGRRGVWAFSRRLSAAVRRRRTDSILAASVIPRSRKALRRPARTAMVATGPAVRGTGHRSRPRSPAPGGHQDLCRRNVAAGRRHEQFFGRSGQAQAPLLALSASSIGGS